MIAKRYLNLSKRAWDRSCALAKQPVRSLPYEILSRWLAIVEGFVPKPVGIVRPAGSLFITGHWRTGTTLLHELICADGNTVFPTTADCMNPQTFLLSPRAPTSSSTQKRPMDEVRIGLNSPQEDEFALFLLGAPSPYALLLYPELISAVADLSRVELFSNADRELWNDTVVRLLATVQGRAVGKPVVVKSPPHSFRVAALSVLFHDAKFIHMVREPYAVFASTRRMWRTIWELYALSPVPADHVLDEAVADTMVSLDDAAFAALEQLPSDRWAIVDFEQLVHAPAEALAIAAQRLQMPFLASQGAGRSAAIELMKSHRQNAYSLTPAERAFVRDRCAVLFDRHGYEFS